MLYGTCGALGCFGSRFLEMTLDAFTALSFISLASMHC